MCMTVLAAGQPFSDLVACCPGFTFQTSLLVPESDVASRLLSNLAPNLFITNILSLILAVSDLQSRNYLFLRTGLDRNAPEP